jgi:hypothetical protein
MLDEFTSTTRYHQRHAIQVLKNQRQVQNHLKGKTKTYKSIYEDKVVQTLEQIGGLWAHLFETTATNLAEGIKVLECCQEIEASIDTVTFYLDALRTIGGLGEVQSCGKKLLDVEGKLEGYCRLTIVENRCRT